jgi:hypothetical protein
VEKAGRRGSKAGYDPWILGACAHAEILQD